MGNVRSQIAIPSLLSSMTLVIACRLSDFSVSFTFKLKKKNPQMK